MSKSPTVAQFQGCLIGCAVGDAVGAPVEKQDSACIERYIADHVATREFGGVTRFEDGSAPFGQYTDDTQLTRELAISLVKHKGLVPEDFAARLADLFRQDRLVGGGRTTKKAMKQLVANVHWSRAGGTETALGNGSAMRASPIGLAFHVHPRSTIVAAARTQGIITHNTTEAAGGSVAMAAATALACSIEPGKIDSPAFLSAVARSVDEVSIFFGEKLRTLARHMAKSHDPHKSHDAVVLWLRKHQTSDVGWPGISPYVLTSVMWALYSFLTHPDDYWACITEALSPGGDVDTTAAMAGAVAGAHLGLGAVPQSIASQIHDRGEQGYDYLLELGSKMFQAFA